MRNILMAAVAAAALMSAGVAMADEFNQGQQTGASAYLDNQATDSQLADPTAPDSVRSHGHP